MAWVAWVTWVVWVARVVWGAWVVQHITLAVAWCAVADPCPCLHAPGGACRSLPSYSALPDADRPGDNIMLVEGGDLQRVAAACSANSDCRAFSSRGWLKRSAGPTKASSYCFYTKTGEQGGQGGQGGRGVGSTHGGVEVIIEHSNATDVTGAAASMILQPYPAAIMSRTALMHASLASLAASNH